MSQNRSNMINNKKTGFTVVEVLIIAPIVVLVIGAFITAVVNMTGDVLASRGANDLAYSINDALSRIEQDVKLSNGYLATNNITLVAPQGSDNATAAIFQNATPTGPTLILSSVATTTNPLASTRNIVYSKDTKLCNDTHIDQNEPMPVNIIYFTKNGTLWRRTILPSNYTINGCDAINKVAAMPWQQPTCAPTTSGGLCKTQDTKLVNGLTENTSLVIDYFTNTTTPEPSSDAGDSSKSDAERLTALQATKTVNVTINANLTIAGRKVTQNGSIKVSIP